MKNFANYRVVFGGKEIDYKNNLKECLKYIPDIIGVFQILAQFKIYKRWYFFEPYVEITWIDDVNHFTDIQNEIINFLKSKQINDYKFSTPKDGKICDWYCDSDEEREFGYKTYIKSCDLALLFYYYDIEISIGKGLENHYMRRCHVLANQLALNYKEEGVLLLKRAILCFLFWFLGHNKAVWIYTRILRQSY